MGSSSSPCPRPRPRPGCAPPGAGACSCCCSCCSCCCPVAAAAGPSCPDGPAQGARMACRGGGAWGTWHAARPNVRSPRTRQAYNLPTDDRRTRRDGHHRSSFLTGHPDLPLLPLCCGGRLNVFLQPSCRSSAQVQHMADKTQKRFLNMIPISGFRGLSSYRALRARARARALRGPSYTSRARAVRSLRGPWTHFQVDRWTSHLRAMRIGAARRLGRAT